MNIYVVHVTKVTTTKQGRIQHLTKAGVLCAGAMLRQFSGGGVWGAVALLATHLGIPSG